MKKTLLFASLIMFFFSCTNGIDKSTYLLEGNFTGIEDGTKVVLIGRGSHVIDSTVVASGKAIFKGSSDEPKNVIIAVEGTNDRKYIWIEPGKKLTLTATTGAFNKAELIGSENYRQSRELAAREKVYEDRMEAINDYATANYSKLTKAQIDSLSNLYRIAEVASEKESQLYIAEFPDSFYSVHLLDFYKTTYGKEITQNLFLEMASSLKSTSHGKSIIKYLEINKELQIGDQYIDVTLNNTKDLPISLSDVKSKYTLIEFWSSRCGPCRLTNPKLVKIYQKYQTKGFEIYGISLDTKKDEWLTAVEEDGLLWENVVDLNGNEADVALQYGISVLPHNFLLDQDGKVIAIDIWSEDLEKKLEVLLP